MIAQLGTAPHHKGGPILGRAFLPPKERSLMAKASKWLGLTDRPHGTYIRPHAGGYAYGRWSKQPLGMGYRFEELGECPSVEACRAGLEVADKAIERRTRELNTRKRRA